MRIVSVVNYKGGSSKTTTAVLLGYAFTQAGLSTLIVDADPQGSALEWSHFAGDEGLPTIGLATPSLHKQLPGLTTTADLVIIDTPPLEQSAGIVHSALRIADFALIPCAPTPLEMERLTAMTTAFTDIAPLRFDGNPPASAVLLTRTVPNAASTKVWRAQCEEQGWDVLDAEVRRREAIAQAMCSTVPKPNPYTDAAVEVLERLH